MAAGINSLQDLEKFLAGDGRTLNRRKIRRSLGNRKSRKAGRRKGIESTRVKLSEKVSHLQHRLKSHQSSHTTNKE